MLFGTRHQSNQIKNKFKLSLDNTEINRVDAFKFLGVTVDQILTWKNHIDELAKKMFK